MTFLQALILGVVQGLTEFFPISSSGHLVIAQALLGLKKPEMVFDVGLHFATLIAVIIYFWRDIVKLIKSIFSTTDKEARRLVLNLLLASVPAGIAGILFNDFFETMFGSPKTSALMLLLTGIIVLSAIFSRPRGKSQWNLKWHDALIVGIAQALAIMPGISRSGSTITAGLHLGIEGKDAASFSFLLSIPAILGAALVEGGKISLFPLEQWPILALGMISAGIMGYITIASMMKILSKGKLYYFAPYCILVGMIAFFML